LQQALLRPGSKPELVPWPRLHEALVQTRRDGMSQSFVCEPDGSVVRTLQVQIMALPGLGLSIVKNTVLSLGGDIGVTSELGVGSLFWIELPPDS
jgi:hypothetical protein